MIRFLLYEPAEQRLEEGGVELLERWRASATAFGWIDFFDADRAREAQLLEALEIHPLAISDAQRDRHPPKLEVFDHWTFLLLRGLDATSDSINLKTIQLALFVSERLLVTRHVGASVSVDTIWREVLATPEEMAAGPAGLTAVISKTMAKRYLPILHGLESRLGEIEDQLMDHSDDEELAELVGYKTRLRKVRRNFRYHESVFRRLRDEMPPPFDESHQHALADVYDAAERLSTLADMYYEVIGDLIEGYISIASHRLNQIMKLLTIVTTIFVPLGFLAGLYGMNFEYIPELHFRYSYFILLSVMGAIVLTLLAVFRRRKWL